MDWRAVGFDWNRARAFLAAAEEGSFSSAARALRVAQPTVGRQVATLEEELGVTLFQRAGNRLELTPTGLDVLEHVRSMGEAAARVSLVATGQSLSLEGEVRITASELIAAHLLPPVVARLRREHPGIELEIVASNDVRDLSRREADIAIRNFAPEQPDLLARRLHDSVARLYATPAYLERIGSPTEAAELADADFFGFDDVDRMVTGLQALGLPITRDSFPIRTDNHLVQWSLCRAGAGICIVMEEVGDADATVVRVLPDVGIPVPMWVVAHRELRTSRRIRVVFDQLAEALG